MEGGGTGVTNDWSKYAIRVCNMHQSFVTTAPTVLWNNGDIDFCLCQDRVYARHCGESLMVKALLKSRKLNVKNELLWPVWEWNQNPAIP